MLKILEGSVHFEHLVTMLDLIRTIMSDLFVMWSTRYRYKKWRTY